ncbi:MAG TPA: GTPase Era [Gemmatimonadales bacterium]|jgi:GTP-binding protein Era|nr:GTPase Era [Gemmatimonadales bacterium]
MPKSGHIALAGRPNVGKSSLLNALVGEHLALVSRKAQATRLPVTGLRTDGDIQYVFHDLPGLLDPDYAMQHRMRALALAGVARADLILHLHPAPEAPAPEFWQLAGSPDRLTARPPVLTVYTKGDLIAPERRSELAATGFVVSTRTGEGVTPLLEALAARLPEREFAYPEDEIGTQPMRFFAVEFLREAAFEQLEDELPYAFTAEIEEFRETTDPVYIRAALFVERESQKGILIGEGGRTLKAIGKHARERLEQLLGRRVYLETWVKVLPKWRRDPEQLRRFGFPDPLTPDS